MEFATLRVEPNAHSNGITIWLERLFEDKYVHSALSSVMSFWTHWAPGQSATPDAPSRGCDVSSRATLLGKPWAACAGHSAAAPTSASPPHQPARRVRRPFRGTSRAHRVKSALRMPYKSSSKSGPIQSYTRSNPEGTRLSNIFDA